MRACGSASAQCVATQTAAYATQTAQGDWGGGTLGQDCHFAGATRNFGTAVRLRRRIAVSANQFVCDLQRPQLLRTVSSECWSVEKLKEHLSVLEFQVVHDDEHE